MSDARHILVTGASKGLGFALVEGLLEDGYTVSCCSRSLSPRLEARCAEPALASRLFWRRCHVGDAGDVDRFVREAIEWSGTRALFGLINNAGIAQAGILASFPNADSERILQVNLLGAIQMARAATPHLLKSAHGGRIINISSIIGTRGYNGLAAYSASKAGMDGLTRALARELGRRRITVNSVAPGYMATEMSATLSEGQLGQITRRTPVGRLATEADVLALVRFLLGDGAQMITGQTILVDGGISC